MSDHKMFIDNDEHYQYMRDSIALNPAHTIISTFGVYAGITHDGQDITQLGAKYKKNTKDILDLLRGCDTRMLVGVANYKSCKTNGQCIDCEKQYVKMILRTAEHADFFNHAKWRMTTELHLKCCLFFYSDKTVRGLAGGRNFTDSEWADISFELNMNQIKTIYKHTKDLWDNACAITDSSIGDLLIAQGISEEGMQAILNHE